MKRVAYFVNQYPMVSHSFIRREINALERIGMQIERFAIRSIKAELQDPEDLAEYSRTTFISKTSPTSAIFDLLRVGFSSPKLFISAVMKTLFPKHISHYRLHKRFIYLAEACVLKRLLAERKIDHLHAHFGTNSASIASLCRCIGGPPFSFTVHGPEEFDHPAELGIREKIELAEFVVAISSFGKSQLYRWTGSKNWPKIKVVRCGLELDQFIDTHPMDPARKRSLVCVGRLCEQKGQLLLVAAFSELIEAGYDLDLTLVGDGPMRSEIEALISEKNLSTKVRITGWLSSIKVREQLLQSYALILPSFAEGLPVVIMEAMASGRPAISTYIAGIPELIEHRKNGFLFISGDMENMKEVVLNLISMDNKNYRKMCEEAKRSVMELHNIEQSAMQLKELFNRQP